MSLILDVPGEIADSLFQDNIAGIPGNSRSAASSVQVVIDVLGIAANMTTIVVGVAALPELARRLVAWRRKSNQLSNEPSGVLEISVRTLAGQAIVVSITRDESATDIATAKVTAALDEALRNQADGG